jgi:hypothetical protein
MSSRRWALTWSAPRPALSALGSRAFVEVFALFAVGEAEDVTSSRQPGRMCDQFRSPSLANGAVRATGVELADNWLRGSSAGVVLSSPLLLVGTAWACLRSLNVCQ